MAAHENCEPVVTNTNVQEFFRDSVDKAVSNQNLEANENTLYYIVNLLTGFTQAEELFERTPEGQDLKPLALLYADAISAETRAAKSKSLKRLGDTSLYLAGFFSNSLSRKVIDVDYYISMGGNAYSYLSETARSHSQSDVFQIVFEELSKKFTRFVDVLGEVSEKTQINTNRDIVRLYEVWVRTGSPRTGDLLQKMGIQPLKKNVSKEPH